MPFRRQSRAPRLETSRNESIGDEATFSVRIQKKLEKLESLLSKENLYNYDKKTFDDTINQIGEIKKKISFAEERWLEIQILNDEINKQ